MTDYEAVDAFMAQHCVVVKQVPLGVVVTCKCGFTPWLGENESEAVTEHLFKTAQDMPETPTDGEEQP